MNASSDVSGWANGTAVVKFHFGVIRYPKVPVQISGSLRIRRYSRQVLETEILRSSRGTPYFAAQSDFGRPRTALEGFVPHTG